MIGMEIAARLGLPSEQRRDLFYAILLKDAGCSSSAARMCELFATDDRDLKREFSRVDWTSKGDFVRFAARAVAPGDPGVVPPRSCAPCAAWPARAPGSTRRAATAACASWR